jgi:hypothetical protein
LAREGFLVQPGNKVRLGLVLPLKLGHLERLPLVAAGVVGIQKKQEVMGVVEAVVVLTVGLAPGEQLLLQRQITLGWQLRMVLMVVLGQGQIQTIFGMVGEAEVGEQLVNLAQAVLMVVMVELVFR